MVPPRVDTTSIADATFTPLSELKYGAPSNPTMRVTSYPKTTTTQNHEKIMIRIKGGYAANNPGPLSFSGSTRLWYNPMINLYIQRLGSFSAGNPYQIVISGVRNPYPYEM